MSGPNKNQDPKKENGKVPGDGRLYDLTMIQSMSGGDPGFMKKMILLFIETVPQNVQEMVEAAENSNWEQTAKMAHKLKSTVDSMGIKTIHDDIRQVESNAKQQIELDNIPSLVNKIEKVIDNCIIQLKAEAASTH